MQSLGLLASQQLPAQHQLPNWGLLVCQQLSARLHQQSP
ncbi:uncharacterized protein M6B38_166245 [Iris pallida]|uniref:Uncharacterized protein n=1 Tax=Iris pallida TaxID=29817 RepID=A0AAX6EXZ4_IRIPA|nr:uncharacterized protein M6B38_166245 [Iris pallida]